MKRKEMIDLLCRNLLLTKHLSDNIQEEGFVSPEKFILWTNEIIDSATDMFGSSSPFVPAVKYIAESLHQALPTEEIAYRIREIQNILEYRLETQYGGDNETLCWKRPHNPLKNIDYKFYNYWAFFGDFPTIYSNKIENMIYGLIDPITDELRIPNPIKRSRNRQGNAISLDVDFAIGFLPDLDAKRGTKKVQNFMILLGFYWGRLGSDRVILLCNNIGDVPKEIEDVELIAVSNSSWEDSLIGKIKKIYRVAV